MSILHDSSVFLIVWLAHTKLSPLFSVPAVSARFIASLVNTYTLFDGFTDNTGGYFTSCVVFFPSPAGGRKNASNE